MIKKMDTTTLGEVMQIWIDVNTKAHDFIPEKYWTDNFDAVKEMLPDAEVYIYEENGSVLGFVGLADDYIEGIFVSCAARSQGIGKKLLDYAKGIKPSLSLRVYKKNDRAIRFYEREEFSVQSEGIDAATGESELLMSWSR